MAASEDFRVWVEGACQEEIRGRGLSYMGGSKNPMPGLAFRRWFGPPGVAAVSFTQIDDLTLDSSAIAEDGTEIMYARRRKSQDRELFSTLQRLRCEDGTTYCLVQVYQRA